MENLQRERGRTGMTADGKGQKVNAFRCTFIQSYWISKACDIFLFLWMLIASRSSFGIMDQFAFCWHIHQYLCTHQTTGSRLDASCVLFISGVKTTIWVISTVFPSWIWMNLIGSSVNTRCTRKLSMVWELIFGENWEHWCVREDVKGQKVPTDQKHLDISSGFDLYNKHHCSPDEGSGFIIHNVTFTNTNKPISPFLQHQLILPLPLLFEIGGELMPHWEKSVERDFFLPQFGFNWKGRGQFQEAEDRKQKEFCKNQIITAWELTNLHWLL